MAGKDSKSKGSGRGLNGETGFSGGDGRGVRGDKHEGSARTDTGVGVAESLRRFGGRTSRSSSRRIKSVAISDGRKRTKARPRWDRARSVSVRHVRRQPIMPPRPRPKPKVRSGSGSQSLKETAPSRDEEDSIFIKSGNLTTATWRQMNQIPSGVFPYIRRSPPSDAGPVRESYEECDSDNDEGARKKKRGGKAPIPEQYPPRLLSDLIKYLTEHPQSQVPFR